jgi:hypothetical protein
MADGGWLVRHRTAIYLVANLAALLASLIGAQVHDQPSEVAIYACALLALCSAPLLFLQRLNDRYALLGIFMACYYLFFGAKDLQILWLGTDLVQPTRDGLFTPAELLILAGALCALVGYLLGAALGNPARSQRAPAEWPAHWILLAGLVLWALGMTAGFYYQIYVVPSKLGFAAAKGMANMGPVLTLFVMLGQMMTSVGVLMLAYGYAKYRGVLWTALIVAVVATQVVVAFIEDIKGQAVIAPALVIMTRVLVTNRMPKAWIAYLVAFLLVAFPIFQAYRAVSGERGLDRAQALQHLDQLFEKAVSATEKVNTGSHRAETFLERSSSKGNLDVLLEHVGVDVPYLEGTSLAAIPLAFVPRLLMPDKVDVSVGELFGRVILKSDSGVYISISHLGELYWNFGSGGVFLGMFVIGSILGFVGGRFSLENGVTLTRVMVLLATVQPLCMGFGGTMPVSYVVWARAMAAIGLMHLCFARRVARGADAGERSAEAEPTLPRLQSNPVTLPVALGKPVPRFPNLLR